MKDKDKARPHPDPDIPQAFAHHHDDGSVNRARLVAVALQFRMLRLKHAMTANQIIDVANHLANHFDGLRLTVPPTVQALRSSKTKNEPSATPSPSRQIRFSRKNPQGASK